jgi:hypothetical protein
MATKTTTANSRNIASELAYLIRALKAPSLAGSVEQLAERARSESWSYEEFLAACRQREVVAREAHGGEGRVRAARFPSRKSLEEFDCDHQRSLKRFSVHLGRARRTCRSGSGSEPARPQRVVSADTNSSGCTSAWVRIRLSSSVDTTDRR